MLACSYLKRAGLKHLQSNYHCRYGEIDLIMLTSDNTVVFVEVKFRKSRQFGNSLEMVGHTKQQKIRATASHFLMKNPNIQKLPCRFDVVGLTSASNKSPGEIIWIENAFS